MKDSKYSDARVKSYFLRRKERITKSLDKHGYREEHQEVTYTPSIVECIKLGSYPLLATHLFCKAMDISAELTSVLTIALPSAYLIIAFKNKTKVETTRTTVSSIYNEFPIKKSIERRMANV